jgi:NTE family protein
VSDRAKFAVVLTGGGARAAYQAGLMRGIGRMWPSLEIPVITGVSAGAINASCLAAHAGTFAEACEHLWSAWASVDLGQVVRTDSLWLARNVFGWAARLASGGRIRVSSRALLDTAPLRRFLCRVLGTEDELTGIARNIESGRLEAAAFATIEYHTGQTVTWVQGRAGLGDWTRANRVSRQTRLTIDHVMASASLPMLFPAIRLGDGWYGDGGVRLMAPLSPALFLGADRILAISTRYARSAEEAATPEIRGYPPPAQILGKMLNAVFLDVLDRDVRRLQRLNGLLERLPQRKRNGLRPIRVLLIRPSRDLGRLAAGYEERLPSAFRFALRGLGSNQTKSPDFLSMLMFEPGYVRALMEIGEADAEANRDTIAAWIEGSDPPQPEE